ncbi:MAG: tetratricopeptide repeat protein [Chlorobi bacterium]|nr:tetratricopeptide repeat protein [Chlorobiota bacterium]
MKKFLLFLLTVFLAYITAFYVTGTKNGYKDPFDFKEIFKFSFLENTSINESYLDKGIKNLNSENYDDALDDFFDALSEENTSEVNYYIGYTYLQKQNYKDAIHYSQQACDLNLKNSGARLVKGEANYYSEKYQDAINDLYFCTELSPEESKAYYYLALCYSAQGKYKVALQSAETALEYDSTSVDYWYEAGYLADNVEDYNKAVTYYRKSLTINPKDKYSLLNLGLAYNKLGNRDSALYWYNKTLKLYPNYSLAYNNRGYIFQTEGDYLSAIKNYNSALKYNSKNSYALWNRADSYFALKKYESAVEDYKKIYELKPKYYNALYYIAVSYENMTNIKDAVLYYQKFLSVADNDNKNYKQAEEKIKLLQ